MRKGHIYTLKDPTTNEIRYVGKTLSKLPKRLSSHYNDKSFTHKANWINKLKKNGLKPIIESVEVCDENMLNDREIYWISYYKDIYKLTNLTNGGDGLPIGFKHTDETKNKIRQSSKKPNNGKFKKGHKRINNEIAIEKIKKTILVYNINGNFIDKIKGVKKASEIFNINKNLITSCLKNKLTHVREFRFYYYYENYPLKIKSIKNDVLLYNRKINEYDNGVFIKEYLNIKEASKELKIKYYIIHNVIIGKTKKCRKYPNKKWVYVD